MWPSQMTQVLHPSKFPKHPTLVQLRVCVQDPQLPEVSTDQHDEMATDGCVAGSHSVSDPKTARRLEIQGQTVDAFPSEVQYYLRLGLEKEAVRLGSGDWANPFSNCAPLHTDQRRQKKITRAILYDSMAFPSQVASTKNPDNAPVGRRRLTSQSTV